MNKDACHVLLGPEIGFRNDHVDSIRSRLKGSWGELEEFHYYYPEIKLSELVDLLRNGSLFSSGRLFILKNAELVRSKEEAASLLHYLDSPPDDVCLILVSDATRLDTAMQKVETAAQGNKKIFWEMFEGDKLRWIEQYTKSQGLTIAKEGRTALLELVENNSDELRKELERLCLFFPKGSELSEEDVECYVAHNREENVFSLFDRIAEEKYEESLAVLAKIQSSRPGDGLAIVAGLMSCFKKLLALKRAVDEGQSPERLFQGLRIGSKRAQKGYSIAASRFSLKEIEEAILAIGDCDFKLRSGGSLWERVHLELLVYSILSKRGRLAAIESA